VTSKNNISKVKFNLVMIVAKSQKNVATFTTSLRFIEENLWTILNPHCSQAR